jgi:hypothetical protein
MTHSRRDGEPFGDRRIFNLKKALPLLEEFENKNGLALTFFLLAKNEEALNHREEGKCLPD